MVVVTFNPKVLVADFIGNLKWVFLPFFSRDTIPGKKGGRGFGLVQFFVADLINLDIKTKQFLLFFPGSGWRE